MLSSGADSLALSGLQENGPPVVVRGRPLRLKKRRRVALEICFNRDWSTRVRRTIQFGETNHLQEKTAGREASLKGAYRFLEHFTILRLLGFLSVSLTSTHRTDR